MAKGVMLAAAGVCFALPLRAQITSYVDESGKRIYINAIPPPSRLAANVPRKQQPGPLPGVRAAGSATVLRVLPTVSASKGQLERMVSESSARHGVDPQLVRAVIEAESGWNPIAVSEKGALGLMQLIPATAVRYGVSDVFDPAQNVEGGVHYLGDLLVRYQGDLRKSLAAYHAGESAVDRAGGVPNFRDTRAYVDKVTYTYFHPGSLRGPQNRDAAHFIYREMDERGQVIFTNE